MFKRSVQHRHPPATAPGERVYAIGDIHGRLDLLDQMIVMIDGDLSRAPHGGARLVLLGDYVDRGLQSAFVIDRLIQMPGWFDTTCLAGNHEAVFADFLERPAVFEQWRGMGGLATMQSYGLSPRARLDPDAVLAFADAFKRTVPAEHGAFLAGLATTATSGDYLFVHAGIRPGLDLVRQSADDLLWIRDDFLLCADPFEKFVVHGHSPVQAPDLRPNRLNIDTGAYATGCLTCAVLEDQGCRFLRTSR